jgi:hypothetical protein
MCHAQPRHDTGRFGEHDARLVQICWDRCQGGHVPLIVGILVQRPLDQDGDLFGKHAAPVNGSKPARFMGRGRSIEHIDPFLSWSISLMAHRAIYSW